MSKQEILQSGPKTRRWIDRAEWLYLVAERSGNKENTDAAYAALRFFVDAQECRQIYEALTSQNKDSRWRNKAARFHRQGVKGYEAAKAMIFGAKQ